MADECWVTWHAGQPPASSAGCTVAFFRSMRDLPRGAFTPPGALASWHFMHSSPASARVFLGNFEPWALWHWVQVPSLTGVCL